MPRLAPLNIGCIIFSVGERKSSLPRLNFCKKIGTHIKENYDITKNGSQTVKILFNRVNTNPLILMIKLGCSISSIARYLNRSRTTIYNELKGGSVEQINISVYL
nr:helix-turn-helix domain-containing protein [uncultured Peptostreptococcus sp.]